MVQEGIDGRVDAQTFLWLLLPELSGGGNCELIAAFVFRVPGMSAYERERDRVLSEELVEQLPAIDVGDGNELTAVAAFPAVAFPTGEPFHAAFGDVGAVGDDFDGGPASEEFEAFDDGLQFHLVVCGERFTAAEFLFASGGGMPQNAAPATGAGVTAACAVGEQLHKGEADGITSHWRRVCCGGGAVIFRGRRCVRV